MVFEKWVGRYGNEWPSGNAFDPQIQLSLNGDTYIYAQYSSAHADLTRNGQVGLDDFSAFARHWMQNDCFLCNQWCGDADIDHNGRVGMSDLFDLINHWLDDE